MPTVDEIVAASVAADPTNSVYFPSSAISSLLSTGAIASGSGGAEELAPAVYQSIVGQLTTAQDEIAMLETDLAVSNNLNATLAGQVGSLQRDLATDRSIINLQSEQLSAVQAELARYEGATIDSKPGTLFDRGEKIWYDVTNDPLTLSIGVLLGAVAAFAVQPFRPGIRSAAGAGAVGTVTGIIIAEAGETAFAGLKNRYADNLPWWNPLGYLL